MAEIHVNNITDFINAIKVSGNTVILDNDLDAQTVNWSSITLGATLIDGKGHSVFNIQASGDIFRHEAAAGRKMQNISFRNIVMTSAGGKFFTLASSTSAVYTVENCQFQGKFGYIAGDSIKFEKCFFDIAKCLGTHLTHNTYSSSAYVTFTQCYFIINGLTMDNTTQYYPIFRHGYVTNCYFKGEINVPAERSIAEMATEKSVINFNTTGNGTLDIWQASGVNACIYNSDRIARAKNGIACTDSEMKNAQTLKNKGFDIVV